MLYVAGNRIFRSTDVGSTGRSVSDDLTRNDPEKLKPSGGPITHDNTGAEVYCTIFALAESPQRRGLLWAGTDDGLVHVSRGRRRTWQNITPPDLPEWALISIIEPSPHDAGTAYMAATRYKHDDTGPTCYKTTDYGATWTLITNGIPDGRVHPRHPRGPEPAGPALRRHRDRHLRLVRRRRATGSGSAATSRSCRCTT